MDKPDGERLKRLTVVALASDDELVNRIVLKGGNALSLAHNLASRASFDLDYSMEDEFEPGELASIRDRVEFRLQQVFYPAGYIAFDVKLEPKPENISPELESFWGGYSLEFKLIAASRYGELNGDLHAIRREAVPARPGGKARFEIDISRHEYCAGKKPIQIDDFTIFAYTPAMVACEKVRAICQQMPSYAKIVKKYVGRRSRRAHDFFDIYEILRRFRLDLLDPELLEVLRRMFYSKRVPLALLREVVREREFHRVDWDAVRDTVAGEIRLRPFDFYFDFVVNLCGKLADRVT